MGDPPAAAADVATNITGMKEGTIKAVIFDLDGTLLDTEALGCRAVIDSFELTNAHIPNDVREKLRSAGDRLPWDLKKQVLGLRGSEWVPIVMRYAQENWRMEFSFAPEDEMAIEEFWRTWEGRLNELCGNVKACPGAPELVDALDSLNIPMAIATSSRAASVQKKRKNHEKMFNSIKIIVTGDDERVLNGKPAPDIYLEAARRLGVNPSECLVFEDALTGAQSGYSASCHVVAVPDSRMDKQVFRNVSDAVIKDLWHFSGKMWQIPLDMKSICSDSSV